LETGARLEREGEGNRHGSDERGGSRGKELRRACITKGQGVQPGRKTDQARQGKAAAARGASNGKGVGVQDKGGSRAKPSIESKKTRLNGGENGKATTNKLRVP